MLQSRSQWFLALALTTSFIGGLSAKVTEEEILKLEGELTPVGAVRAANADGTIPEWTGGITTAPDDYKKGKWLVNPFAEDKILFTITKDNLEEYKEKLSPGQYEMFKKYPDSWKMNVYKTRRSVGYDDFVYDAIKKNGLEAALIENGNSVKDAKIAFPFPIPANGLEVVWNHILKHYGSYDATVVSGAPTPTGAVTLQKSRERFFSPYSQKTDKESNQKDIVVYNLLNNVSSPPQDSGSTFLIKDSINEKALKRQSWYCDPYSNCVKPIPMFSFDDMTGNGEIWADALTGFSGSPQKYEFKLIGKKEMYVPYNNYELMNPKHKYSEIVKKGHFNPELLRFELHRVWELEVTLKKDEKHISPKRTLFIDEDSWNVVVADYYNGEKKLWKTMQSYEPFDYISKGETLRAATYHDLNNGRYYFQYLRNEEKAPTYQVTFDKTIFTTPSIGMEQNY